MQVVARAMWTKCKEHGDIYLDRYEGWCATKQTAEMMAFCDFFCGHGLGVLMFWTAMIAVGSLKSVSYIYKPCGWINSPLGRYMVREERFITEQEAQEWDYKD